MEGLTQLYMGFRQLLVLGVSRSQRLGYRNEDIYENHYGMAYRIIFPRNSIVDSWLILIPLSLIHILVCMIKRDIFAIL